MNLNLDVLVEANDDTKVFFELEGDIVPLQTAEWYIAAEYNSDQNSMMFEETPTGDWTPADLGYWLAANSDADMIVIYEHHFPVAYEVTEIEETDHGIVLKTVTQ